MKKINDINPLPLFLDNFDINEGIKFGILPAKYDENEVYIINEEILIDALNYYNKLENVLEILITDKDSFERLKTKYIDIETEKNLEDSEFEEEYEDLETLISSIDILQSENDAPVIKFVNSLFFQAIKKKASDIHIETHENNGVIRFRIDGVLFTQTKINKTFVQLIINRIKVISNLDISKKHVPQDGRTQIKIANTATDIRVSILPTYFGEKVVLRLLMQSDDIPTLENLGFDNEVINNLKQLTNYSYGMILVTGPTGSGKSTTLHSFLQQVATPEKNIITIEDPVEYKADNINQIQVNTQAGLTFASGLRSILRQDPDVIMIGEIRDKETASIAIQSALTGHLVLSTLHTNSAIATITRLIDIGIEPFLISSSILGILSQRLVRVLCDCKKEDKEGIGILKQMNINIDKLYKEEGCKKCNFTGYKSRKAIGELIIFDDKIKEMVSLNKTEIEIDHYLSSISYKKLQIKLIDMMKSGETSLKEALRIGLK